MKWKRPLRMLRRMLLVLLLLALVFLGIAFLPGSVEGNYRGRIVSACGCDGISFLNLRQGRMIHYYSAHPPAFFMGPRRPMVKAVPIATNRHRALR